MTVKWMSDDGELHTAERAPGPHRTVRATVESMGEVGWDWHVWDAAGQGQPRYGMADTLEEAKRKAEAAMAALVGQVSQAA